MKFLSALFIVLFSATTAFPCIQSAQQTNDFLEICISSNCKQIAFDDVEARFSSASKSLQATEMSEAFQRFFNETIMISTLDQDDPDRAMDPDSLGLYWSDIDGNKVDNTFDARYMTGVGCYVGVRYDPVTDEFQLCSETLRENRTCP